MKQPLNFKFYATLLDSFNDYIHSDMVYNRYWGFSENPPFTEEEFQQKQFEELINKINRVPFESEAADRGTAFNEVIDCMIEGRKSEIMELTSFKENNVIQADYKDWRFMFPLDLCREFANYFKGALTQQLVEAILPTAYGNVLLYGYIDELMPISVHDIKTTGRYSAFKFKNHFQHLVYPYCLIENGNDVRIFEYNIVELRDLKGGMTWETFTESYTFVSDRDIPILTRHCEQLIEFLNENKALITDKKIFAEI